MAALRPFACSMLAFLLAPGPRWSAALSIRNSSCISYNLSVPMQLDGLPFMLAVTRMYGFADADPTIPIHSWDGPVSIKGVPNMYAWAAEGNFAGAINNGFDQYAVYITSVPSSDVPPSEVSGNATVSGLWPNVAYFSVQLMYGESPNQTMVSYAGSSLDTFAASGSGTAPNPFVQGSPTVLSHRRQDQCISGGELGSQPSAAFGAAAIRARRPPLASVSSGQACSDANTFVYRLSADVTALVRADSGTGGCSAGYLFAPAYGFELLYGFTGAQNYINLYNFSWGVIKVKVPFVFDPSVDTVFRGPYSDENQDGYDANYFSVSAHQAKGLPDPNLPFTVNAGMMRADGMMTADGHSYVLFAPMALVPNMTAANLTEPPRIFLPRLRISAYVLAAPSYAFMFRYKEPSAHWTGSPSNVPCAGTIAELNSSRGDCSTLGPWAPQISRMDAVGSLQELAGMIA